MAYCFCLGCFLGFVRTRARNIPLRSKCELSKASDRSYCRRRDDAIAPDAPAAQVITPFTVCATFKASRAVDAVVVRDRDGEHRVTVEAVR